MTATKDQPFAVEHLRLRIVSQIDGHGVATSCIMDLLQTLLTDRNKLRFIIGRARRLRIPLHTSWPEHIALSLTHTVDVALQFFVCVYWHMAHESVVILDFYEGVLTTELCVLSRLYKVLQHRPLQCLAPILVFLQLPLAGYKNLSYDLSQTHLTIAQFWLQRYE